MPSGKGLGQHNLEHTFEFLITLHWLPAQIGMVMGQGGVGLKDGVFAPASHDEENLLALSSSLGALGSPTLSHKTLLLINLPHNYLHFF